MKKVFNNITLALLAGFLILINSCKEQDFTYSGPSLVSFTDGTGKAFYVQEVANSVDTIIVGVTSSTGVDRTISFSVDAASTAIAGTHYNLSGTQVTIPANQVLGYIIVEGLYEGFAGDARTLILNLEGGDVPIADFDASFTMTMQQYCPFDINDFVGTWDVVDQSVYEEEPYVYQITTEAGGGDTLIAHGLWEVA
ncbi:MAG: hypothetical protein PVF73_10820, partial [Bacteroidales bacterium]